MRESTFLEYTHEILDETPGRTASLEIMGKRLLLTDRQENITAVMLSQVLSFLARREKERNHGNDSRKLTSCCQFSHFGKGHTVHEVFKNVLGDSVFASEI